MKAEIHTRLTGHVTRPWTHTAKNGNAIQGAQLLTAQHPESGWINSFGPVLSSNFETEGSELWDDKANNLILKVKILRETEEILRSNSQKFVMMKSK